MPPPSIEELRTSFASKPCTAIVIGMAGSGKTTLMNALQTYSASNSIRPYMVNLDPAVLDTPYSVNIDIRDTVQYKEVMKQYGLGPNGGIMTSLNLFATRFDQVISIMEKRVHEIDYFFVDTPGQIEVFTWSASGSIITESLSTTFPTSVIYVLDTPNCIHPATFMSNMLYACSIFYKLRVPFVLVFNKTDVMPHSSIVEWMRDYDKLLEALQSDETYTATFVRSMGLVLEEFYKCLRFVGVSAATGEGISQLFTCLNEAKAEYLSDFVPEIAQRLIERESRETDRVSADTSRLLHDLQIESAPAQRPSESGSVQSSGLTEAERKMAAALAVDEQELRDYEELMNSLRNEPQQ